MIRYYEGEDPILPNVPTYLCWRDDDRAVRAGEPGQAGGEGGQRIGRLRHAGGAALHARSSARSSPRSIRPNPRNYIAQPTLALSRVPTIVDDHFEGRHVDLRPYVLYGKDIYVLPGGLTRVAMRKGSLVVNSSQGGGSKDTWVLAAAGGARRRRATNNDATASPNALLSRVADAVYWMGRYIERAENVARFIDVNLQPDARPARRRRRTSGSPWCDTTGDRAAFRERYGDATQENVVRFLAFDPRQPQLDRLLHAGGARERALRPRDHLLGDVGADQQPVPADHRCQPATRWAREPLPEFCHRVRMACHLFQGIAGRDHEPQRGLALHPPGPQAGARRQDHPHPGREVLHPAALGWPTWARPTTTSSGRRC